MYSYIFQRAWLTRFTWLRYIDILQGGVCAPCVMFESSVARQGGRQPQPHLQLVREPLRNLKKGVELLERHASTQTHQICVEQACRFRERFTNPERDIGSRLDQQRLKVIADNREKLSGIIKTIIFIARNEMALRGHRDSERVNPEVF